MNTPRLKLDPRVSEIMPKYQIKRLSRSKRKHKTLSMLMEKWRTSDLKIVPSSFWDNTKYKNHDMWCRCRIFDFDLSRPISHPLRRSSWHKRSEYNSDMDRADMIQVGTNAGDIAQRFCWDHTTISQMARCFQWIALTTVSPEKQRVTALSSLNTYVLTAQNAVIVIDEHERITIDTALRRLPFAELRAGWPHVSLISTHQHRDDLLRQTSEITNYRKSTSISYSRMVIWN